MRERRRGVARTGKREKNADRQTDKERGETERETQRDTTYFSTKKSGFKLIFQRLSFYRLTVILHYLHRDIFLY